ncbi:uncharacterized protein N7469_010467 [Penicillium citrinum]|uniref:Uncharacterized protein n=2 Tax=Penicillium TaxID=5073 RepID=A0A9W9NKH6_PENCI|nr:uncharacterized protein N7469_010467 [Penicillium citrinum]KAJ5221580.1 hypothetical protein N7469_010467 [Penicillium citrinum]KAJ5596546.1 hypothetical protein N7450_003004 [Penicillium hetheringtonii]
MIRQVFSAAASAARPSCTIRSASLNIQPATWYQAKTPLTTTTLSSSRFFSITAASHFTSTIQKSSSPFRLSTDKHNDDHHSPSYDDAYYSPYKPKRQWPPDMSKLSPKHQFRLERKYRRRAALKYARPKFIKTVTLVQWGVIGFVAIYAVLFMNWDTKDTPFDGIRENFFSGLQGGFFISCATWTG